MSGQRGNKVHALKKDQGSSGSAADKLRKVSQKSKADSGLKKPLPVTSGKPSDGGPTAPKKGNTKKVWYNWKKSNFRVRIPRNVLTRALQDQVGQAFSDTVDWAAMSASVLMELV